MSAPSARTSPTQSAPSLYGQGPCETAWAQRDLFALGRHMSIGAAQALVFVAAALYAWAGKSRRTRHFFDRAARGVGEAGRKDRRFNAGLQW